MGNPAMTMSMMGGMQHTPFMPMGPMPGMPMLGYQQRGPDMSKTRLPDRAKFNKMIHSLMAHAYQEGQRTHGAVAPGTYLEADGERQGAATRPPTAIRDTPGASSSAPSNVPTSQALAGVGPAGTQPVTSSYSMSQADPHGHQHQAMGFMAPPAYAAPFVQYSHLSVNENIRRAAAQRRAESPYG